MTLSNVMVDGKPQGLADAGQEWHTDMSYNRISGRATILHAHQVPFKDGRALGDTAFRNMYAAYEALAEERRAYLDTLRVVHTMKPARGGLVRSRSIAPEILAARPPSTHPLVRTHPETGRKALYVSRNRMDRIVGMEREESHRLIDDLVGHAIQPEFTYRHKWQQGDIVIWDNRCLMHKANGDYPEGARRFMKRIIVAGEVPV